MFWSAMWTDHTTYGVNIGKAARNFKDFPDKLRAYTKVSAFPVLRHVPDRLCSLGQGIGAGQANVGQREFIKVCECLALAICGIGMGRSPNQTGEAANRTSAARTHMAGGKRCGVERGKHGLSFQGFINVGDPGLVDPSDHLILLPESFTFWK
jgi:hypothetical protein